MNLAATVLTLGRVRLEPFEERHRAGLIAAAEADLSIFRHMPFGVADKGYSWWFDQLRADQQAGRSIPHAVILLAPPHAGELSSAKRETEGGVLAERDAPLRFASLSTSPSNGGGKIVGQSCYLNIRPRDAGVEIGSTWYMREAQGGFVNPAAKLLLLGHAFACGVERVELKTDALNDHSRAAILKLGAKFEGVHRRHMRRADGTLRDTAWYSVLREEWPAVKAGLEARVAAFG
jgi:RimJ/RimL family protein N-acetyltransferase